MHYQKSKTGPNFELDTGLFLVMCFFTLAALARLVYGLQGTVSDKNTHDLAKEYLGLYLLKGWMGVYKFAQVWVSANCFSY